MTRSMILALFLLVATFFPGRASMDETTAWPTFQVVKLVGGLSNPAAITNAGDGSGRLFIVEQTGRIQVVQGSTLSGTFLDISGRVLSSANGGGSEEGLLGLAFPPGFGAGRDDFYVYYTNQQSNNQVSRFRLSANPAQSDPASEELVLLLEHPTNTNHNGGQLAFGLDGNLYLGPGDGGGGGDPNGNAENPASLLGKLLRIRIEPLPAQAPTGAYRQYIPLARTGSDGSPASFRYAIPSDNPFLNQSGYREEIWALGMRNPWRFSFDRQTGDLYTADVGQSNWEEINFQPTTSSGGENYGWNVMEGLVCYNNPNCDKTGLTLPVWVYSHSSGNCSVTGGYVYRGSAYPVLDGIYFYADYCSGRIWGLRDAGMGWEISQPLDTTYFISTFGESESGELYFASRNTGEIYQIVSP